MDIGAKLRAVSKLAEYIDVRMQKTTSEEIAVENGNVSTIKKEFGFTYGIRAFNKGAWGFSHANNINNFDEVIKHAIKLSKLNAAKIKDKFQLSVFPKNKAKIKFAGTDPSQIDLEDKLKRINEISEHLKRKDVSNRTVSASFLRQDYNFFDTAGSELEEVHYAYNLRNLLVGKHAGQVHRVFYRIGKSTGYEDFAKINVTKNAEETHQRLLRSFKAKPAPAGRLPIVIDPLLCGVFFHEAVGHACEADAHLEHSSVFAGRLGKRVAPDYVTLSDDPTVKYENGYYHFDSEGTPAGETVLIKNGILSGLLHSRETASKMNAEPTGNGRAESPECLPYPRMSNIVLKSGTFSLKEALEGIKFGIYAKGSSGGVVEPVNGNFLFNAQEAFLIENGRITKPLKDVSFGGNLIEILPKIEIVCNDAQQTFMGGICGKKGQHVPVGEFAPHIKISEAMVGGGH